MLTSEHVGCSTLVKSSVVLRTIRQVQSSLPVVQTRKSTPWARLLMCLQLCPVLVFIYRRSFAGTDSRFIAVILALTHYLRGHDRALLYDEHLLSSSPRRIICSPGASPPLSRSEKEPRGLAQGLKQRYAPKCVCYCRSLRCLLFATSLRKFAETGIHDCRLCLIGTALAFVVTDRQNCTDGFFAGLLCMRANSPKDDPGPVERSASLLFSG